MKQVINWGYLPLGLAFLSLNTFAQSGYPPPCEEAKLVKLDTDPNRRQILFNFIGECERNQWKNDKGIVLLREYQNEQGRTCWLLLPGIDDSYRDNPPSRFASFNGDIILVFEADSRGNLKPAEGDKDLLNQCLEQIIGDRVYTRPTIKTRWTDNVMPFTNRKMKRGASRISGGNGGSVLVIFNADGSYQKVLPI
ncbi:hypothetical protein [Spirosoma oryzicola]|uniref:hypothetical protein n=1 Tax=Spirosoma oryzicola TaxID=2898794 RepID=UPI001E61E9D7|nr:hypothetical protein [Spirosoma oryzicola]UHG94992.1 hypothetical protein LQ777_30340 [Spirosoma oryzicola]